jgi:hypothetical protein
MGPPRDEMADALKYGQLKPEEAEARLLELGLPTLAPQPDPANFNPMGETWWTLPMALAWIAWRSPREVLEAWDPYRTECWDWHFREWRVGPDGPVHAGYFSEQREPATMMLLILREKYDRAHITLQHGSTGCAASDGSARSQTPAPPDGASHALSQQRRTTSMDAASRGTSRPSKAASDDHMKEIALCLAARIFDQPIIGNQYRSAFIEAMIEPYLALNGWIYAGDSWGGGIFSAVKTVSND